MQAGGRPYGLTPPACSPPSVCDKAWTSSTSAPATAGSRFRSPRSRRALWQSTSIRRCWKSRAHRLAESGATNCEFVAGDAYELSTLAKRQADFVFLANAFHGVPDRPKLARAVGAALKPGGLFAVVSWHRRPREETTVLGEPRGPRTELRMSPDETAADVEAGGLGLVRVVEIPPYHYGVVFARKP